MNSLIFWRVHRPLVGKSRTRQMLQFGQFNRSQKFFGFWNLINQIPKLIEPHAQKFFVDLSRFEVYNVLETVGFFNSVI